MENSYLWWTLFNLFILAMLVVDLGVFHRQAHVVSLKESLSWTAIWIALALGFNAVVYFWLGPRPALEFFTGYLIEKSLAVDNIFVFVLIFSYFRVPPLYQHKVLFWGIVGALVMRAVFIFAGVALIERFHWMIYVFGGLLVLTGVKMLWSHKKEIHPERNPVVRLFKRLVRTTDDYVGDRFVVRRDGLLWATPLLVVLLVVELSDVIFAVDSIPAILAITLDPFIVYSSNALAILGLRSLYFAIGGLMQMFHYLHFGLAGILIFVGAKMLLVDTWKIPIGWSLATIAAILAIAIAASLVRQRLVGPQTGAAVH